MSTEDSKIVEMVMEDQLARTKAILDTIIDGVVTINENGVIDSVNPAVTKMFGYLAEELIGHNVSMLMPSPHRENHDGYLAHYLKTGEKKVMGVGRELMGERKDGSHFAMHLAVTEMSVGGERMFTGVIRDLSDQKASELVIRDQNTQADAVLNTVIDGIITIDEYGLIERVNPAVINLFGYQEDELIGQNIKMLMPDPYNSEHDGYLEAYRKTSEKHVIGTGREVRAKHKDGRIFPIELAVSELQLGETRKFTGVIRDITDRKEAEKAKEEFISTVSHELRTPLTSIRGSIGLLIGIIGKSVDEKSQHLLKIAHNNTERLLLLINDILDLSKLEAGKMDFNFKEVKVEQLLDQAIEAIAGYADQHNVTFVSNNDVGDAAILGDEDRLMQIMNNLMSNAAKFAPPNDEIQLSAVRHRKQIRISVTDHGKGIARELQPKIFEKFTQGDSSDTRLVGGTGLGLNITKAMVEKHSGRINFVSEPGVGTTFYFDIPELLDVSGVENQDLNRLSEQDIFHHRVLICEDEPDIASLIRLMLAQAGYEADVAYSVKDAENLLNKHQYAAMTLDIMLPDKSGVTFYEELQSHDDLAMLPVIFVSAKANQIKAVKASELPGHPEWINKPIDEAELISAVDSSIKGHAKNKQLILHVEDDEDIRVLVQMLIGEEFDVLGAGSLAEARNKLSESSPDLILLDKGLPDGSGMSILEDLAKLKVKPKVLIFSAEDVDVPENTEALVKSKTSNESLIRNIRRILYNRSKNT